MPDQIDINARIGELREELENRQKTAAIAEQQAKAAQNQLTELRTAIFALQQRIAELESLIKSVEPPSDAEAE